MAATADPGGQPSGDLEGKRVLILFPHVVQAGGALLYTLKLAGELARTGARVGLLTLRFAPGAFEMPPGVEVLSLNGPLTSSLRYWLLFPLWQVRIERRLTAWRPDVLVSQVFPSNWWGWLYKRRHAGVRLVWVCHEPSAFIHSELLIGALKPFWKRWLAKGLQPLLRSIDLRLARHGDRVITNSRHTAEQFARVYGRKSDGVATPGIDVDLFAPGGGPRERALITVAHLVPYKRVDFLLRVFAALRQEDPKLLFHVVGDGPAASELRLLARELGLGESVVFHGSLHHQEVAALNRRSLLFVSAGVDETFGMAPLEAIASGTPVVAHCSGGPREFVSEKCGRLIGSVRVEDWVEEISGYLKELLVRGNATEEIRECAKSFDWRTSLRPAVQTVVELFRATSSLDPPGNKNVFKP